LAYVLLLLLLLQLRCWQVQVLLLLLLLQVQVQVQWQEDVQWRFGFHRQQQPQGVLPWLRALLGKRVKRSLAAYHPQWCRPVQQLQCQRKVLAILEETPLNRRERKKRKEAKKDVLGLPLSSVVSSLFTSSPASSPQGFGHR